jgi:hypothetical protein
VLLVLHGQFMNLLIACVNGLVQFFRGDFKLSHVTLQVGDARGQVVLIENQILNATRARMHL